MARTACRHTAAAVLCAMLCLVGISAPASADSPDARAAEDLVLAVYFEGMPEERARQLTPSGAAHLIELLRAGDHERFHANMVLALGISGHEQAFETLEWYGRDEPGDLAPGVSRARIAAAIAMGHLARGDDRALAWLTKRARASNVAPHWRRAERRSDGLADTLWMQVMNGLAVSGRIGAAEVLDEMRREGTDARAGAALQMFHQLRTKAESGTAR
ncbi:MAG: hypothetical protein VCE43_13665 [Myxococcota bacterium]